MTVSWGQGYDFLMAVWQCLMTRGGGADKIETEVEVGQRLRCR